MSNTAFRAVLLDPSDSGTDRPEIRSNDRAEVDRWAAAALIQAASDATVVNVYQTSERHIAILTKKGKPA